MASRQYLNANHAMQSFSSLSWDHATQRNNGYILRIRKDEVEVRLFVKPSGTHMSNNPSELLLLSLKSDGIVTSLLRPPTSTSYPWAA